MENNNKQINSFNKSNSISEVLSTEKELSATSVEKETFKEPQPQFSAKDSQIAGPYFRLAAYLVDLAVNLTIFQLLLLNIASKVQIPGMLTAILILIMANLAVFGLIIPLIQIYLTSRLGGSIGKLVFDMQVVNSNDKFVSFKRAFFRNYIGYIVSNILLKLGFIWIIIDKQRQSWHDQIAGTWVTVKGKGVSVVGIILLVLLLAANSYLAYQNYQKFTSNKYLYKDILTDIISEITKEFEDYEYDETDMPEVQDDLFWQMDEIPDTEFEYELPEDETIENF